MRKFIKKIKLVEESIKKHDLIAESSISLIASGNVVSKRIIKLMNSDLIFRAAEGKKDKHYFPGLENFYDIENAAQKDVAEIFRADFVDLRPISGSQANMIVYAALTNVGDTIIVPSIFSGSHVSTSGIVIEKLRNYNFVRTKSLPHSLLIDMDDLSQKIRRSSPQLVVLGGSVINEWQDIDKIVDLVHKSKGLVMYDASHVAGLIAQGLFPNPLDYGVDIMTMTTCKTIPGPSHAWIFGKNKFKDKIEKTVFPGFVSGGHLQEYVGAIVSLYEIMSLGSKYSKKIIEYSRLLGSILEKGGFSIIKTSKNLITDTHQIICEKHVKFTAKEVENRLSEIGIYVNENYLPENNFEYRTGLRLGTQEIVRLGASRKNVIQIGNLIIEYLSKNEPDKNYYKKLVKVIRNSFSGIQV
jgi:glycine hydroxymethyltransferase